MVSTVALTVVFLAGSALLIGALRWWRPEFPLPAALGYLGLVFAFFAQPLLTGAPQIPTDLAYNALPWNEAVSQPSDVRNPILADTLLEQLPFHTLVRERLLAGRAPLWANELGTGEPLLGNAQAAPFAPLHLMALPLAPILALTAAAAWELLVHLLLVHALLLRLGARNWGAALAAVSASLSTYHVAWSYDTIGMSAVWIPGILLGALLLRDDEPRGAAGLVACVLGLALSGHPETLAHGALATATVVVALLLVRRPGRLPFLGRLVKAAVLCACLAAPALLPLVDTLPANVRQAALDSTPLLHLSPPFEPSSILPVVDPLVFGSPRDGNWRHPNNFNEVCTEYAGLLPLALAIAGMIAFGWRERLIALGGVAAGFAALKVWPAYQVLATIPIVGSAKQGRLRQFFILTVAVIAGAVLERVAEQARARIATAFAILLSMLALFWIPPPPGQPWQYAWWLACLSGASAALFVLLVPRLRSHFPIVVVAAAVLELFVLEVRFEPSMPPQFDLSPPPALQAVMHEQQHALGPFRVLAEDPSMTPNLAALVGLWDPRGNDPMRPGDAARMLGKRLGHNWSWSRVLIGELSPQQQPLVNFLGVRFLLADHSRDLPSPWKPFYDGVGGRIWENPEALPLFFLPRHVTWTGDPREAEQSARGIQDFAAEGSALGSPVSSPEQSGFASWVAPRPNGFDLEVTSPTGGLVMSSVSYALGWAATMESQPLRVLEVDGGFLGFIVPAGVHKLRVRYEPRTWIWGVALFGVGLCSAIIGGVRASARSRPRGLDERCAGRVGRSEERYL